MYNLKDLPKFKISRSIELKIQEIVLKNLGLDNLNKLRDKFEGVAFFNKVKAQIMSLIAIEKFLNINLIDWTKLKNEKLEGLQQITLNDKNVVVVSTLVNEPFFIPRDITAEYLIFTYISNSDTVYLAGYLPKNGYKELINENISPIKLRTYLGSIDNNTFFQGMDKFTGVLN